jgi:hypothetical protein
VSGIGMNYLISRVPVRTRCLEHAQEVDAVSRLTVSRTPRSVEVSEHHRSLFRIL